MIIVLIHWRIEPTHEAVSQFFEWWKTTATLANKDSLVGEFLSAPLPASQLPFKTDDLTPKVGERPHKPFVNVGIWKDWQSFEQEVGHNFKDDGGKMDFEAMKRRRTILRPEEWRVGNWHLPETSTSN